MQQFNYQESDIIRFLRNEMEKEEKDQFEEAMNECPELKEEVDFHRKVMKGLELNLRKETKEYLKRYEKTKYQKRNNTLRITGFLRTACIIFLVMGVGILIYLTFFQEPSNQKLAFNYFEPYPNHLTNTTRGGTEKAKANNIDKAMRYYSSNNFQKAIAFFKKAIDKNQASGLAHFYLGNSYLAVKKPKQALIQFKDAQGSLAKEFKPKNQWFMALAYLWNNQEEKALKMISNICESGYDFYCKKGQRLKKEI